MKWLSRPTKQQQQRTTTNKHKRGEMRRAGALLVVLSDETTDQPSCFLPFKNDALTVFVNPSDLSCSKRKVWECLVEGEKEKEKGKTISSALKSKA
jgi:hypothetical protein